MGEHYRQLSFTERCAIARLREAGQSLRQIAASLDRPASTVSRELKRNSGTSIGYQPDHAAERSWARRWSGSRLERDDALREAVLAGLRRGWSPEQVVGRLALETGQRRISHESIYRFIYAQLRRTNDGRWRYYLPRAKGKRGKHRKPGGSPASFIKHRQTLDQRPDDVADRRTPGHWEADYMQFATPGASILVAHERQSRLTLIARQPNRKAEPTAQALAKMLEPLPEEQRKTISFDNGTEFARHFHLTDKLGIKTYFCDPHSPWQKGGVENAIGRLRRYLPRGASLDNLNPKHIQHAANAYNNTPRKCLDFKTPIEAFSKQPLHFKCESTSPPSLGMSGLSAI